MRQNNTRYFKTHGWTTKCYFKIFCIDIQKALRTDRYFSWSAHTMFTIQSQNLDHVLISAWTDLFFPSWSFQQEVSQCYDTEKHQQVRADERPATAVQPVSQRTLSPPRSIPEESRQSVFVQRKKIITVIRRLLKLMLTHMPTESRL